MNETIRYHMKKHYFAWLLCSLLLLDRFLGLAPSQSLPFVGVILENPKHYPIIVAVMLLITTLFIIANWMLLSHRSRRTSLIFGFTTITSLISLWISNPIITENTFLAGISSSWYFAFTSIGFLIGYFATIIAFNSLMIRNQEEAKVVNLPRVPLATFSLFVLGIPIVGILVAIYKVLLSFAPEELLIIGPCITAFMFLFEFCVDMSSLLFRQDKHGNDIPYHKRINQFKKIFDTHDYMSLLSEYGPQAVTNLGDYEIEDRQDLQRKIREEYKKKEIKSPVNYKGQLLESVQIEYYFKDGNPKNKHPQNYGIKLYKENGNKGTLRTMFIPKDNKRIKQEVLIPIDLVESYAEEYIKNHSIKDDLTIKEIFSFAFNQAMIESINYKTEFLLHRAVESGQEQKVKELLTKDIDVNEQAEAGWTALMLATAQGYPKIASMLLDAGANPDVENLQGITPLIYSSFYKNIEICKLLLEYGANPDLQDIYGKTALMVATSAGSIDIVNTLLKAKANTNIKNMKNMTALDIAYNSKQGKIAKMLRKAQAIQKGS